MKTKNNKNGGDQGMYPRTFSFEQLSQISDENYGVLNQCVDLKKFKPTDVFVLKPFMFHNHSHGKRVRQHLRAFVYKSKSSEWLALQDLSFDQWKQGRVIYENDSQIINHLN